jgi:hypothetical protein
MCGGRGVKEMSENLEGKRRVNIDFKGTGNEDADRIQLALGRDQCRALV